MRTETRKLAGIATMVCGSMVTFGAHAFEQGVPDVASGPVEPLVLRDAAPVANAPDAPDAITQAVVDAFAAQTPRAFADDANVMRETPVSYAAPIAVVTPRREAAEEADNAVRVAANDEAADEVARATNETVIDEGQYAVEVPSTPATTSSSAENDALAQRDAVEHQDMRDEMAVAHAKGQEAEAPVKPLPVSYAAPIAVPVRKAKAADAPREAPLQERARAPSMQHEQLTSNATPTPPPVSPVHEEPVAHESEIVRPPVSYARPIAVPASRTVQSAPNEARLSTGASLAKAPAEPQLQQTVAPQAEAQAQAQQAQTKAPVSYAAPIAVPQAARRDTPPGGNREVKTGADTEDPNWSSKTTVAISEEKLDSMRGGFEVANGLKISFGVSRMAVVNGNLVTQTSFNIPDLSNITTQQAQALAAANMGSLLQNGVGNVAQQGSMPGLSGAVIQNTLSNQNIQTLTTLNATVNSLGFFKNLNLGDTLNNALLNSVRPR